MCNKSRVRVYAADISLLLYDKSVFDDIYNFVSDTRKEKIDRMRTENDKCLSLGAEYLFICACCDFGIDYKNAELSIGENSKPYFSDIPVYFNLSHSEKRVMCIMSDYPVGCDVEKNKKAKADIAKRYFCPEEYNQIISQKSEAEQNEMFFGLWTQKESVIKCTGLGLGMPLNSFSVSAHGVDFNNYNADGYYRVEEYNRDDGYSYATCVKYPSKEFYTKPLFEWKEIKFQTKK